MSRVDHPGWVGHPPEVGQTAERSPQIAAATQLYTVPLPS
ncbi:hypothetical protein BH23ACT9_BH23ACT9_07530 [soil metagenome]